MKILVVRFSSIGDIVLTTPVIRALKHGIPEAEIHFLTKPVYKTLLTNNPNIHKVWTLKDDFKATVEELRSANFDHILDLHNNLRTLRLAFALRRKKISFPKINSRKWFAVRLKKTSILPNIHVVQRYAKVLQPFGLKLDDQSCDFYIDSSNQINPSLHGVRSPFLCLSGGAQFATKVMPHEKLLELLSQIQLPVVILGGKEDREKSAEIIQQLPGKEIYNLCGECNLQQSASWIAQSAGVLTYDTGLMHIASCFDVPLFTLWGNTVPELGMYPYRPKGGVEHRYEVSGLSCRPCSKIGFQKCPEQHFKCMINHNTAQIAQDIHSLLIGK